MIKTLNINFFVIPFFLTNLNILINYLAYLYFSINLKVMNPCFRSRWSEDESSDCVNVAALRVPGLGSAAEPVRGANRSAADQLPRGQQREGERGEDRGQGQGLHEAGNHHPAPAAYSTTSARPYRQEDGQSWAPCPQEAVRGKDYLLMLIAL